MSLQGFNITEVGNWPRERYDIKPITSIIPTVLGALNFRADTRIYNNPVFDLNSYTYNAYWPYNSILSTNIVQDTYTVNFLTDELSTLIYVASSIRAKRYDSYLNFFALDLDTINYKTTVGFLLYPKKLFLKPQSVVKNVQNGQPEYTLTAKASLINSVAMYFDANDPKHYSIAPRYNRIYRSGKYLDTNDDAQNLTFSDYPTDVNNEVVFYYGISSTQSFIRQPIINFTENYNPIEFKDLLDSNTSIDKKIRWTTPFIEYNAVYQSFRLNEDKKLEPYIETLRNSYYDNPTIIPAEFITNITHLYSPTTNENLLTFLMVQSGVATTGGANPVPLIIQDSRNSVLSATLNLKTTEFSYNAKFKFDELGNAVNVVSGEAGTNLNLSYFLDTDRIKYFGTSESVQNTLIPADRITVGSSTMTLATWVSGVSSTRTNANTVIYKTKYPPHYYSYDLSITKPNPNPALSIPQKTEVSNLSFNLTSVQFQSNPSATRINTYLYADFNTYALDLPTFAYNANGFVDKIKYSVEYPDESLLNSVSAFIIKPTSHTSYNLRTSPWVNAYEGNVLEITFPPDFAGTPTITIRASLSTLVGRKDAPYSTTVELTGLYKQPQYPLYIETVKEGEDFIDVSAASMVSVTEFPGIDLTGTTIKWFVKPTTDPNIKVNYLLRDSNGNFNPINTIPLGTDLNFGENTWAIRVSGYGPQTVEVTLYSNSLSSNASLSSDPTLFNYFSNRQIVLEPITPLNNFEKIRTISLSANVPYKGREYPLPGTFNDPFSVYWNWSYDNAFNSLTTPISAKYYYGQTIRNDYPYSEINTTNLLSSLYIYIDPPTNAAPATHTVKVNIFTLDTTPSISATYQFVVDDYPAKSIFNADFSLAYQSYPNVSILNTRNNTYVLTRPDNDSSLFRATANTDIIPTLNALGYQWTVIKNGTPAYYNNVTTIDFDVAGSALTEVKFKVLSAAPPGWPYLHNIEQSIKIYRIPQTQFNKSLDLNIFSEYAWPFSRNLTFLDTGNYNTLSVAPTSYGYKKSQTEIYNVSASPFFTKYKYTYGSNREPLSELTNNIGQLVLPYNTQFFSTTGVTVSLTAYNDYYPENTPLRFQMVEGGNLVTKTYNITAQTIPYNAGRTASLRFKQNPKLIDYNTVFYTFTATVTSFDTDINRTIFINQNLYTNPNQAPALPENNTSTITYILSTPKWKAYKNVPPVDGTYELFTLRVGDDFLPLTVNGNKLNTLRLNASADLNIKIPSSTFDNYAFFQYSGDRDLWNTKNIKLTSSLTPISNWNTLVAYSTSTAPEIFFNTYYTTTALPVFVEFLTPVYESNPIVSYTVNFGDNTVITQNANTTFYHQYSSVGTFFITYSAVQQNGSFKKFFAPTPFIVKEFWPEYNQESIRILNEKILALPYSLEEIYVQPNEFGDKDIFNTALTRLDSCLKYLKDNSQTMNVDAPIVYYGWLGSNSLNQSAGIRWYTSTYGAESYNLLNNAISLGTSYFTNIKDIKFSSNYIYVLDNNNFRLFNKNAEASEIIFDNTEELNDSFANPQSIAISENDESIYIADSIRHKVYRFDFDFSNMEKPIASLVLTVGSFGSLNDANKFDYPSELVYQSEHLYVLDYNNNCVKEYSKDLSWVFTYYDDIFANDQIQNIAVHPTGFLYVLGKSLKMYIFDNLGETAFRTIELSEISQGTAVSKIFFDDVGEFLYIVTSKNIFKYSAVGEYITTLNVPANNLDLISGSNSEYKTINIASKNSILRFQDFVEIFRIGEGIDTQSWTLDQILLKKEEFAQDLNYNAALQKLAQNLKIFRSSLNSKFVLVSEQTSRGIVTYYSLVPLNVEDRPVFHPDVEAERLYIGTNEFHIPSVVNRELEKLYVSIETMKDVLNVTDSNTNTSTTDDTDAGGCTGSFCWSWKSMSCYNLSLPLIRLCNINPITYAELTKNFPINYAPTKTWGQATSTCCSDNVSPLDK